MNLKKIRELASQRDGGIKNLAASVGMSESGLHRCITSNKIDTEKLELIACELGVPVGIFFEESTSAYPVSIQTGDSSPVAINGGSGNRTNQSQMAGAMARTKELRAEIAELRSRLKEKDERIAELKGHLADKDRLIELLSSKKDGHKNA